MEKMALKEIKAFTFKSQHAMVSFVTGPISDYLQPWVQNW